MYRCELEIIEGRNFPAGKDGGAPDSFVAANLVTRGCEFQTDVARASRSPAWCSKFIFDGCKEMDEVLFEAFETRSFPRADQISIGKATLSIGGPRRSVGSLWVNLQPQSADAQIPSLRVAWSMKEIVPGDAWQVRSVAEIRHCDPIVAIPRTVTDSTTIAVDATTVAKDVLQKSVEELSGRMEKLELRMDHLDSIFQTRRDYDLSQLRKHQEQLDKESAKLVATTPTGCLLDSQSLEVQIASVQPKFFATITPHNPVTPKLSPTSISHLTRAGHSALQSILLHPTTPTASDEQLAAYYRFAHVPLPEPRWIGFIPSPPVLPRSAYSLGAGAIP
jgi:hypothetical protein